MSDQSIVRNWDGTPTIFDGVIEENCKFENTLIEGFATIIIDKEFLDDMKEEIEKKEMSKNLVTLLTDINNMVIDYYFSKEENAQNRKETYSSNYVKDEYGLILGTKLSSLKGKNIAECSEKSIAAYTVLKKLYDEGKAKSKPSLMLSSLKSENNEEGPHAFVILDRENAEFPIKHILFDVHNPSRISVDGEEHNMTGLYALTDEQYENLKKGIEVTPQSLFELASPEYKEVGEKRTFGSKAKDKTI